MADQCLPKIELPFRKIDVCGNELTIKGLTRAQIHEMRGVDANDLNAVESRCLAYAIGCTFEEASTWLAETPADVAGKVMDEIFDLSGLADKGKESSED